MPIKNMIPAYVLYYTQDFVHVGCASLVFLQSKSAEGESVSAQVHPLPNR